MKNLLFAELYRMKKSKSPLILLLACFGLSLASGAIYGFMFGNAPWLLESYEKYLGFDPSVFTADPEISGISAVNNYADFIGYALKGNLSIYIVLFIAIFLLPLRRSGFIKNIASAHPRSEIFFVHAVLVTFYAFLLVDVSSFAMILISFIFFRGLPVGGILNLFVFLITASLLLSAIGIVVLMLTDFLRRQMSAIIISTIYLWVGAPLLYTIADLSETLNPNVKFRIQYISLVGNLRQLTSGRWDMVLSALLMVVLYVGLSVLLEMTLIKRRDLI